MSKPRKSAAETRLLQRLRHAVKALDAISPAYKDLRKWQREQHREQMVIDGEPVQRAREELAKRIRELEGPNGA